MTTIKLEQPLESCGECKPRSIWELNGGFICSSLSFDNKRVPKKDVFKLCIQSISGEVCEEYHLHLIEVMGIMHCLNGVISDFFEPFDLDGLVDLRRYNK